MNTLTLLNEIEQLRPRPILDVQNLLLVADTGVTKEWLILQEYFPSSFDANVMVRYGQARNHS